MTTVCGCAGPRRPYADCGRREEGEVRRGCRCSHSLREPRSVLEVPVRGVASAEGSEQESSELLSGGDGALAHCRAPPPSTTPKHPHQCPRSCRADAEHVTSVTRVPWELPRRRRARDVRYKGISSSTASLHPASLSSSSSSFSHLPPTPTVPDQPTACAT